MGFVEGGIEGEKVFSGRVFPKTLLPPSSLESPTISDLVELVKRERAWLSDALHHHGAILFRGFGLGSAQDFARVVESFGWDEFRYRGAVERLMISDRVYTANESPPDVFINFHHEMALIKVFPAKIFFFCLQPSPEGGQTSMVRSDVVVERMEEEVPRVVEKLELGGMRFVLHRSRSVWQRMLRTQKEREAEERALESLACNSVRFNDDGSADFNYGPINPIREYEGERVWFNSIAGVVGEQELQATFDDGSPLPMDAVTAYQKITEENCVDVSWRKGDVLLVNNLKVQHARRPGRPPRVLLVSLCN